VPPEARENMLTWAAAAFDNLGPDNEVNQLAMPNVAGIVQFVSNCRREQLTPGSWGAQLYEAADREEVSHEVAGQMILDYVAPSLDTTIAATGQLLLQLGHHPEQWELLKSDPTLVRNAVEEVLRFESPIRGFSRVAAEDVDVSGVKVPKGARVLALYASANRDEEMFENADHFDITRKNARKQLAFGNGIHQCAAQHLARLEISSLLNAMIKRVDRIEVANPVYVRNNTLRVLDTLDVTFIA